MKYIEGKNVRITDGFWRAKQNLNRNATINAVWDRFSDTGRIEAFEFKWRDGMDNKPHFFWDSDVAKWMEGAAYLIEEEYDETLEKRVEYLIDCIEKNQGEDGYFNIFFTVCEPEERFRKREWHELYCAGHLIEAAVAYYRATGRDRFLKCMEKYTDYIYQVFVVDKSADFITPGHQEIELALVRMYNAIGKDKYLELAKFFVDNRGVNDESTQERNNRLYNQSHLPAREQREAVGHAVRACYWYKGMADVAYETGDKELFEACRELFEDIIAKKMYITGGIGSTHIGEAFTIPYDLPNDKAYNETCASIAMMFLGKSMMKHENKSIYADIIEKELYNGMLSGWSLDGKAFFYENPLEINLDNYKRYENLRDTERYPITQRKEVFDCSCCPPNINRTIATINEYIYGIDGDVVYVNQFMTSEAEYDGIKVWQKTNYPACGKVELAFENTKVAMIRKPAWCDEFTVDCEYTEENGYIKVVNPKDVTVEFAMKPVLMRAKSDVVQNAARVALMYGPVVYCAESVDNIENLSALYINKDINAEVKFNEGFGMNEVLVDGYIENASTELYSKYNEDFEGTKIKMIPYCCFANRGETNMLVWMNVR